MDEMVCFKGTARAPSHSTGFNGVILEAVGGNLSTDRP